MCYVQSGEGVADLATPHSLLRLDSGLLQLCNSSALRLSRKRNGLEPVCRWLQLACAYGAIQSLWLGNHGPTIDLAIGCDA